jgi:hypothetical protein
MKAKYILIMLVVAAGLVAMAVVSSHKGRKTIPDAIGKPLLPEFDASRVSTIRITTADASATIRLDNDKWSVVEKHGYPADVQKLGNAITSLKSAKIRDVPRLSEAKREELGVVAPPAGNAKSASLTFSDAQGQSLATLLLGKEHMQNAKAGPGGFGGSYPDGRYVSNDGGKTIVLANEALGYLSSQPLNWIEKNLLNLDASDLARVILQATNATPLELTASKDGTTLELVSLGEDEMLDTTELSTVRNALSYFDLKDIASPELSDDDMGLTDAATYTAETTKGIAYTVTLGGQAEGDNRYIRFAAGTIPTGADPGAIEGDSDDSDVATIQEEVNALNAKLSPWTFIIAGYKADAMMKTRQDLVNPKEDDEENAESPQEVTTKPIPTPVEAAGSETKP